MIKDLARQAAVAGMRAHLRAASRAYRPAAPGALIVAPHPDDETLGCGGYIAAGATEGRKIGVLFLTGGEASHPGHPGLPPKGLAERRRGEALAALGCLGVPEKWVRFCGLPDGGLDGLAPGALAGFKHQLLAFLTELGPTEVLAPYREGGSTEHAAATRAVVAILGEAGGGRLLEYPVWAWWNPLRMRPSRRRGRVLLRLNLGPLLACKRRALACHRTQVEPAPPWPKPVLPRVLARACCGPDEFFFASDIPASHRR